MGLNEDVSLFLPSGAYIATYPAGYFLGDAYGSYVCDYDDDSGDYSVVAIAGTENYFLTNRPPATSGGSYAGDLQISFSAWENIQTVLDSLNSNIFYYAMGYDINGDYRYYMTPSGYSNTYYVCNSAGQLYYYLKDDSGSGGSGTGSDFDATEIITAINSVFDAIENGFYATTRWLSYIQDDIQSFNTDVILLSQNMVSGFSDLANIGNNIVGKLATLDIRLTYVGTNVVNSVDTFRTLFNDYFYSLGKKYPQLMTVRLSGNDNLFDWDSGDIIQNIEVEKADAGDTVSIKKTFLGDDSIGYEDVTLVNASAGYDMAIDDNGYYRISCVANDNGNYYKAIPFPDSYFCFDGGISGSNGNYLPSYTDYECTDFISYALVKYLNLTSYSTAYFYDENKSYLGNGAISSYPNAIFVRFDKRDTAVNSSYFSIPVYASVSPKLSYGGNTYSLSLSSFNTLPLSVYVYDGGLTNSGGFVEGYQDYVATGYIPCSVFNALGLSVTRNCFFSDSNFNYLGMDASYCVDGNFVRMDYSPSVTPSSRLVLLGFMARYGNDFDYIYFDTSSSWKIYRYQANTSYDLPASDQEILNQTIYTPPNINSVSLSDFNLSTAPPLFYDGVNTIDITGNAVVTIDYYHDGTWFDYIYSAMETQIQLLTDLDIVNETIVNIENTIVDISPDNDAYNIFYIEKEDGTHESIGDAAMDVAKVVGDALSMFYRLVFEDALSNKGILSDFEDTMSGTVVGVDVWS